MARPTTTEKIGEGACLSCGKPVWYRKTSGGNLKFQCDHCDVSGFAQPGGAGHARATASIASNTGPGDSVKEPPAPPPATPVKKKSFFDLSDL